VCGVEYTLSTTLDLSPNVVNDRVDMVSTTDSGEEESPSATRCLDRVEERWQDVAQKLADKRAGSKLRSNDIVEALIEMGKTA
jgi:hypothetical protein